VFAGMERHGHADTGRDIPSPHAAAQHHIVGVDPALGRRHAAHPGAIMMNLSDLGFLKNLHAAGAGALGERLGDIHGVGIAVAGDVNAADDIVHIHERVQRANLAGAYDVDF